MEVVKQSFVSLQAQLQNCEWKERSMNQNLNTMNGYNKTVQFTGNYKTINKKTVIRKNKSVAYQRHETVNFNYRTATRNYDLRIGTKSL